MKIRIITLKLMKWFKYGIYQESEVPLIRIIIMIILIKNGTVKKSNNIIKDNNDNNNNKNNIYFFWKRKIWKTLKEDF